MSHQLILNKEKKKNKVRGKIKAQESTKLDSKLSNTLGVDVKPKDIKLIRPGVQL